MELQSNEATLKITVHCQKRDCPHQNCTPDEWASLKLFWCTHCKRIWCDTCWSNVDAHGILEKGVLCGMEDHEKGKVALQNDQLQQLLVDQQSQRRSLMLTQHHQFHNLRLALLSSHWEKRNKRSHKSPNEKQAEYQAQMMLLEQQNKQRLMKARQEQEDR